MNLSGMLISGINVNVVEHYGNFNILTSRQKDLSGNFLMENIELKNSITKNRLISIILMFHLMQLKQLKQLDVIWMVHISRSA